MTTSRTSSRQRLLQAALALFVQQGLTDTTTKQIAEQAEVNEATLFRQFGNKNGLLLAVLQEGDVFQRFTQFLVDQVGQHSDKTTTFEHILEQYTIAFLDAIDQAPELVRSLIGEAGRYSDETQRALAQGFEQVNQEVNRFFEQASQQYVQPYAQPDSQPLPLSQKELTRTLHQLLIGYATIELTSGDRLLWSDREAFISHIVTLLYPNVEAASASNQTFAMQAPMQVLPATATESVTETVAMADLPDFLVHDILLRAKKQNPQAYAIIYTLFGAGVSPQELALLQRIHHISNRNQHLLQIPHGNSHQIPINQWIMGKRYGTHQKNPLTQWLKSRNDECSALFLSDGDCPITTTDIHRLWDNVTADLDTPAGRSPHIKQAQHTWCVELLMRGVTPENMAILTGLTVEQLEPYIQRAKEKAAIDQVMQLDKK
ncbi:MAG: TetR family transcriptional regulator [Merismopedia sp. SIO2A8]|nr:TetR family transcriptional regulator [Merismopedia sp. SIO2A8]